MTEPFVLPETAAVLDMLAAQPGPHLADMAPADARAIYHLLGQLFEEPADPSVRKIDFRGPGCPLRAYFPGVAAAGPVIVYMHGGGFVIGDLETHDALCSVIARASGLRVVAIDYRLAPEHPYPAAHEDCLAAAAYIASGPAELEAPVTSLALAGDSAGGNLALHVAGKLGRKAVLAQLLIYPWLGDARIDGESYQAFAEGYLLDRRLLDRFLGDYVPDGGAIGSREVSPLRHPLPDDLPPTVIVTGGLDPLRDQGRALAAGMATRGLETHYIEAAGLIHGMATMRKSLPTGDRVIRRAIATFAELIRVANPA